MNNNRTLCNNLMEAWRNLPKYECRQSGDVKIIEEEIPQGKPITVVSMREALLSGFKVKPLEMTIGDGDLKVYKLISEKNGLWMTTLPQEIRQMLPIIEQAKGRVLIGGLGLGAVAHLIAQKHEVDQVIVVEIDPDIIKLTEGLLHPNIVVRQADLFEFKSVGNYDMIFFDIWQGTGEFVWTETVVPLKRKYRERCDNILCWAEDEMAGQVLQCLPRVTFVKEIERFPPHYRVFGVASRRMGIEPCFAMDDLLKDGEKYLATEKKFRESEALLNLAGMYTQKAGTKVWEDLFGKIWDEEFAIEELKMKEWREREQISKSSD